MMARWPGRSDLPSTSRPLRRVVGEPTVGLPDQVWPGSIPAVRQILDDGLDLGALTILVGDNGAGKSTVVEAIALAFGMSAEGGSTGARHSTRATESQLHDHLRLTRGIGGSRWGFGGFWRSSQQQRSDHFDRFFEL